MISSMSVKRNQNKKGFLCFNLVIEVLLISRSYAALGCYERGEQCFNLVIEVLLISRPPADDNPMPLAIVFQSRNRGSFDFKFKRQTFAWRWNAMFQSRNRGSFDFKISTKQLYPNSITVGFNLVIEVLLISSFSTLPIAYHCNNLVSIS